MSKHQVRSLKFLTVALPVRYTFDAQVYIASSTQNAKCACVFSTIYTADIQVMVDYGVIPVAAHQQSVCVTSSAQGISGGNLGPVRQHQLV